MICEVAILDIKPPLLPQFETAFAKASAIIASMTGYKSHQLQRCIEKENRYILLVQWETIEDHTEGFRKSKEYEQWKKLLHHFYDPFPVVEHYSLVLENFQKESSLNILELYKKSDIVNHLTQEQYSLTPAPYIPDDPMIYEKISSICNEKQIYSMLFNHTLQGTVYSTEKASQFITWAKEGWKNEHYFVYLICTKNGTPVGALDIKSSNLDCAEIGYWCSEKHRGLMTNGVTLLCSLAKHSGYKKFSAEVLKDNLQSEKVLLRNSFVRDEFESGQHETHNIFYRDL